MRDSARVLAQLQQRSDLMRDELVKLANINSGSYNIAGVATVAEAVATFLRHIGAEVDLIALPPQRLLMPDGEWQDRPLGPLLHARMRPEAARRIFLGGHLDTVFPAEHSFQRVEQIDGTRLHGPGVADLKGGLIVLIEALRQFESTDAAACLGWDVVLNPDEEIGSPSSAPLLQDIAAGCVLGLVYEPALPGGVLAGGRKGSGNFTFQVRGRSAHAGRDHAHGRNAIRAAADFVQVIDDLNGQRDALTINPASISGGGVINRVPDLAQLHFNVRAANMEDAQWAEAEMRRAARAIGERDGFSAELHGGFHRPPKRRDAALETLYSWVVECAGELNQDIAWTDTGGCCDGNNLAAAGLCNLDTLGVIGDQIHSDHEWMEISSLADRAALSAVLLDGIARGRFDPAALKSCS